MAKGNKILLNVDPFRRIEGQITDTSKPGMMVEEVPTTANLNARPNYRAASAAAGSKQLPLIILVEDDLQGFSVGTAYAANTRCFACVLLPGDEVNALLGDVAGTGDSVAIGDLFGVNNNGKIIANSSYTSTPFKAQEAIAKGGITADILVWCMVT